MNQINNAIETIETHIDDAKGGLGSDLFHMVSRMTPIVNVDLFIINDRNQFLLTWRDDEFYGQGWHIPGGVLRFKEDFTTRLHAVAKSELNATISHDQTPYLVKEAFNHTRDTRGHFISLLFKCKLTSDLDESKKYDPQNPKSDQWAWHAKEPENLLDVQHAIYHEIFEELA